MSRTLALIALFLLLQKVVDTQPISDSLKRSTPNTEWKKLDTLIENAERERLSGNIDSSISIALKAYSLASSLNSQIQKAKALNILGTAYTRKGNGALALENHYKALAIQKEINDKKGMQTSYNGLGVYYLNNGDPAKALSFLYDGVSLSEKLKDSVMLATQLYNIGLINYEGKEYNGAIVSFNRALTYAKCPKAIRTLAYIYGTEGNIFSDKKDYKTALNFFKRSLELMKRLNDNVGTASTYQSIGLVYQRMGQYNTALASLMRSYEIRKRSGYTAGMIYSYNNLASFYTAIDSFSIARQYAQKAYRSAKASNQKTQLVAALENLFYIESQSGNCKKALSYYHQMTKVKDSLNIEDIDRKRIQAQLNYDFDRKLQINKLEQEKKDLLNAEEIRRGKLFNTSLLIVSILTVTLAIVALLSSLRRKNSNQKLRVQQNEIVKQNEKLEKQHNLLLLQQKEITDSICYAIRIQNALFPLTPAIDLFPQGFVFLQPRNLIGGDFYWLNQVGQYKVAAVVDCTGHGVPAGFMSILGITFLDDIIVKKGVLNASQILHEMREKVINAMHQSENTLVLNDGMDMSLMIYDTLNNTIDYASANGKAMLIRKNSPTDNPTILPVDRMPISYYIRNEPFLTHTFSVEPGDMLFMFTDGIVDQYGGPKQKKLGYKQLAQWLKQIAVLPTEEQEKTLSFLFYEWKDTGMQYDDALLLGIRF